MQTIDGKIIHLNLSPKGFYESFLVENGNTVVQVNFGRDAGPKARNSFALGQSVTLRAHPIEDDRPSSHPVFEWRGNVQGIREGVVSRINYALHGEPNGVILETGEFVHLRPEGAKAAKLQVGQSLKFEGEAKSSPDGFTVIEARQVNGEIIKVPAPKPKKKHA